MDDLFTYGPRNIKDFFQKNLRAILYTIILHLIVAIILVFVKVQGLKEDHELGVLLDFTEETTIDEMLKQENIDVPPEWIEQVLKVREQASNRAVNLNDKVNKEISTEDYVNQLLSELEDQKDEEFKENRERLKEIISSKVFEQDALSQKETKEKEPFTGPTTITYEFTIQPKQRSSRMLTVPVYKCEGSGKVVVDVVVRRNGSVSEAKAVSVQAPANPECFIKAAENAARTSSFQVDLSAPEKQTGKITYQFIAQ